MQRWGSTIAIYLQGSLRGIEFIVERTYCKAKITCIKENTNFVFCQL